jgi:GNAT superfamily N-acetyltransferase
MVTLMLFRAALPADAYALAELSIMAGDGMYEFLLEQMAPKEMLAGLMARTIKQDAGGFSWRHCFVADDRGVVAMINAFPAAWLREQEQEMLPQDRVRILDPIDQAQDWESFLVNGIAVRAPYRRQGVGKRLVRWAIDEAAKGGFARLSANVWEDNAAARALFAGFQIQKCSPIAQHPGLNHVGASLLMVRYVRVTEGTP